VFIAQLLSLPSPNFHALHGLLVVMAKYVPTITVLCAASLWVVGTTPAFSLFHTRSKFTEAKPPAAFGETIGKKDEVVGVSVTETALEKERDASAHTGEVFVFGSFMDAGSLAGATNFSGTVPLNPGEYVQHGVAGATLAKTFVLDGNQIELNLTWSGVGDISSDTLMRQQTRGAPHEPEAQRTANRSAVMSGTFTVNGFNRISGETLSSGTLSTSKSRAV
jgi:hypothetical protein